MLQRVHRLLIAATAAIGLLLAAAIVLGVVIAQAPRLPYPPFQGRLLARASGGAAVVEPMPSSSGAVGVSGRCVGEGGVVVSVHGIVSEEFRCGPRRIDDHGLHGPIEIELGRPTRPTTVEVTPFGSVRWSAIVTDASASAS